MASPCGDAVEMQTVEMPGKHGFSTASPRGDAVEMQKTPASPRPWRCVGDTACARHLHMEMQWRCRCECVLATHLHGPHLHSISIWRCGTFGLLLWHLHGRHLHRHLHMEMLEVRSFTLASPKTASQQASPYGDAGSKALHSGISMTGKLQHFHVHLHMEMRGEGYFTQASP